jgi:hypothetical protein
MLSARYTCPVVKEFEFAGQIFEKYWNIKFNDNPSSGRWVVTCGLTDGQTDVTTLMAAFRNFAKAIKNKI